MPSLFPRMDPFIEGQMWQDFHSRFINDLSDVLTPEVRPRYCVEIEQYVYLAREDELPDRLVEPDLALVEASAVSESERNASAVSTIVPKVYTVPLPRRYE